MAWPSIDIPDFATSDVTDPNTGLPNVQQPPGAKISDGMAKDDYLPRQWFNWLFRSTGRWITALRDACDALVINLASEATARAAADTEIRTDILAEVNAVIGGSGSTNFYSTYAEMVGDNFARLNSAILKSEDFPVEFRDAGDNIVGTGTAKLYTTMGGVRVLALPPFQSENPDLIRVYGENGDALPGQAFPLTPDPPTGAAVVVHSVPVAVIHNGQDSISYGQFIYSSTGAYPTRHFVVSVPSSPATNSGWRSISITFPANVPNP